MELQRLNECAWVIRGAVNIGLVAAGTGLVAIDTGLDKQSAKTVLKAAEELGRPLTGIVNTHAHADHFGGNGAILARIPVPVYAPVAEAPVIRRPQFEPEYLWQGSAPFSTLQNKFLLAEPSPVHVELQENAQVDVDGAAFRTIPLPGHAQGQVGIMAHGVLFAADAYFDVNVVDKHGLPYMVNYNQTLASARLVPTLGADWVVPGHGEPSQAPISAVHHLIRRHEDAIGCVLDALQAGAFSLEGLVKRVCTHFGLNPASPGAYLLLRTTVGAYVSALMDDGQIMPELTNGEMLFVKSG